MERDRDREREANGVSGRVKDRHKDGNRFALTSTFFGLFLQNDHIKKLRTNSMKKVWSCFVTRALYRQQYQHSKSVLAIFFHLRKALCKILCESCPRHQFAQSGHVYSPWSHVWVRKLGMSCCAFIPLQLHWMISAPWKQFDAQTAYQHILGIWQQSQMKTSNWKDILDHFGSVSFCWASGRHPATKNYLRRRWGPESWDGQPKDEALCGFTLPRILNILLHYNKMPTTLLISYFMLFQWHVTTSRIITSLHCRRYQLHLITTDYITLHKLHPITLHELTLLYVFQYLGW